MFGPNNTPSADLRLDLPPEPEPSAGSVGSAIGSTISFAEHTLLEEIILNEVSLGCSPTINFAPSSFIFHETGTSRRITGNASHPYRRLSSFLQKATARFEQLRQREHTAKQQPG